MPEMPEIHGLVTFLDERLRGKVVAAGHLASFHALKTFDPPLDAQQEQFAGLARLKGRHLLG